MSEVQKKSLFFFALIKIEDGIRYKEMVIRIIDKELHEQKIIVRILEFKFISGF